MGKKIIGVLFLLILLLFFPIKKITSVECQPGYSYRNEEELNQIIDACEQKTKDLRQAINSLASQIKYMDTQIYLTTLKIQETEQKIIKTQNEIETLSSKIEGLDQSLNYLSKLLIERIAEGYKKRSLSLFSLLLDSENADDFFNRFKYLKTAQENNQKLLIQVQQAKLNYEDQKKLREEKKVELANLNITLNSQRNALNSQKTQKQKLLIDTKNSEEFYQQILAQAKKQLAAFKSFVQSSGANTVIDANGLGTGSDGSYYSQRDIRWAYKTIGYSSENILNVGCLLTSIAMFAKKNGQNSTPADIASEFDRFYGLTAYMALPWKGVAGKSYHSISKSDIDQELNNGNYVIVGILRNSCYAGGDHFVLLIRKDGDDYIMHDPVFGPDLKFSSHYSSICSAATFK
ncbi:MAG: hypothetical protein QHH09_04540 [Microgenomates group bacterium]|nr:hypothetical protein [Microgenomates group bacterium]